MCLIELFVLFWYVLNKHERIATASFYTNDVYQTQNVQTLRWGTKLNSHETEDTIFLGFFMF